MNPASGRKRSSLVSWLAAQGGRCSPGDSRILSRHCASGCRPKDFGFICKAANLVSAGKQAPWRQAVLLFPGSQAETKIEATSRPATSRRERCSATSRRACSTPEASGVHLSASVALCPLSALFVCAMCALRIDFDAFGRFCHDVSCSAAVKRFVRTPTCHSVRFSACYPLHVALLHTSTNFLVKT